MKIEISSSDEIAALYVKYIELVDAGREETLDILFAPGCYGIASIGPIRLDLGGNPVPKDPKLDVILRGAAEDPPAVLRDLGMLVNARGLRLENLILTGRSQGLLEARVARWFEMEGCVVVGNHWGGPWGGALMRVLGVHGQPAYTVDIADTWFVRNSQQAAAALLAVGPATGSFVDEVKLRRVTFLENGTHADLQIEEARAIRAEDVLAVKDHRGGAAVLRYGRADQVVIERSTFIVDDPAAIALEDTRTWRSGMQLANSKIYVIGPARELPDGVRGHNAILDGSWLGARRAAIEDLADMLASRTPDTTTARARLRDALGLH